MFAYLSLIILQFGLFNTNTLPVAGCEATIYKTNSTEIVAYQKVGNSGAFLFSFLDPGGYSLRLTIPLDGLKNDNGRDKFESDIKMAYNINDEVFSWRNKDVFVSVDFNLENNIQDLIKVYFEEVKDKPKANANPGDIPQTGEEKDFITDQSDKKTKKLLGKKNVITVDIANFLVDDEFGSFGGRIENISQKLFFKNVIGKESDPLIESGEVIEIIPSH